MRIWIFHCWLFTAGRAKAKQKECYLIFGHFKPSSANSCLRQVYKYCIIYKQGMHLQKKIIASFIQWLKTLKLDYNR